MTQQKKIFTHLTPEKLNVLSDMVVDNIESIFEYFSISYKINTKKIYGPCPIHDGDGKTNPFNFYTTGQIYRGNWKCRSHGCERIFKRTSIGCIRGILSHVNYNWKKQGDKEASFPETIKWISEFLNKDPTKISVDESQIEKRKFINSVRWAFKQEEKTLNIKREDFLNNKSLSFSSAYLEGRGFDKNILSRFDVAECQVNGKEMSGRVIIPIYDDRGEYVVGVTGRALKSDFMPKWRHNSGFKAENYLFNFWNAKHYINNLHSVILVESPLNVLRLEQAGVKNAVATFGSYLNETQLNKLFESEIYMVNLLYDNDLAGKQATKDIEEKLLKIFNTNVINLPEGINDVAEMTVQQVKDLILPEIILY